MRETLENTLGGLTALEIVHGFSVPQLAALYGGAGNSGGSPATQAEASPPVRDPAALRPGERVLTSAELAARLERKRREKGLA